LSSSSFSSSYSSSYGYPYISLSVWNLLVKKANDLSFISALSSMHSDRLSFFWSTRSTMHCRLRQILSPLSVIYYVTFKHKRATKQRLQFLNSHNILLHIHEKKSFYSSDQVGFRYKLNVDCTTILHW
jgi:hypothetical protein